VSIVDYYVDTKRMSRHNFKVTLTMYGETWTRYTMTERSADCWIEAMRDQYKLETVELRKVRLS
jgi:hypothetical protein